MVARPVMSPGKAPFHQALIHRFQGLFHTDHGPGRQHFNLHLAIRQVAHVFGELVKHRHFISFGRNDGLHSDFNRLGQCEAGGKHGDRQKTTEYR